MVDLSPQEINNYIKQGYTMQEIQEAVKVVENQETGIKDGRIGSKYSSFTSKQDENLIKWQLELNEMLERAEHILRGDVLKFEDGNVVWKDNPDPKKNILNDQGVQEIMRILSMYLNRNTILSDYEQGVINNKMYDFGKELNDLFYMKYEKLFYLNTYEEYAKVLGFDFKNLDEYLQKRKENKLQLDEDEIDYIRSLTQWEYVELPEDKQKTYMEIMKLESQDEMIKDEMDTELSIKTKNFPMLIRSMIDIVHSAYQRALDGGERRSLREARQVQQTDQLTQMGNMGYPQQKKKSIFKPWTWGS